MLLLFKNTANWVRNNFLIILLILESSEIGQQLYQMVCSSFVNIGTTFIIFKLAAKVPDENDKLAINVQVYSVEFEIILKIY